MHRKFVGIGTAAVSTLGLTGVAALGFGVTAQAEPLSISAVIRDVNGEEVEWQSSRKKMRRNRF